MVKKEKVCGIPCSLWGNMDFSTKIKYLLDKGNTLSITDLNWIVKISLFKKAEMKGKSSVPAIGGPRGEKTGIPAKQTKKKNKSSNPNLKAVKSDITKPTNLSLPSDEYLAPIKPNNSDDLLAQSKKISDEETVKNLPNSTIENKSSKSLVVEDSVNNKETEFPRLTSSKQKTITKLKNVPNTGSMPNVTTKKRNKMVKMDNTLLGFKNNEKIFEPIFLPNGYLKMKQKLFSANDC